MPSGCYARVLLAPVIIGALVAGGCHGGHGMAELTGTASDEWTRTYTLIEGGTFELENGDGTVDVEGIDGRTVEVIARRTAKAPTDAGATELLPRILIEEETAPDRIAIETEGIAGMLIGVEYEVNYQVRLPRDVSVRLRVSNGNTTVRGVAGGVTLNTTNGTLVAEGIGGGVQARAVNGKVSISLADVDENLVDVRSTNGSLDLGLPEDAAITLLATTTNGQVDVTSLELELIGDQSPRRVRGTMNGGGTPVEVSTVNGGVRVFTHP